LRRFSTRTTTCGPEQEPAPTPGTSQSASAEHGWPGATHRSSPAGMLATKPVAPAPTMTASAARPEVPGVSACTSAPQVPGCAVSGCWPQSRPVVQASPSTCGEKARTQVPVVAVVSATPFGPARIANGVSALQVRLTS